MNELPHITKALERQDIQGIILRGYESLEHAAFALLAIEHVDRARAWLRHIELRDAMPFNRQASQEDEEKVCINLAFTYEGVKRLLPEGAEAQGFSRPFIEGMVTPHRTRVLGDFDRDAPEHWQWGADAAKPIHILLMIYAKTSELLQARYAQLVGDDELLTRHGLSLVQRLDTNKLKDRKEHFGFRDGIAQPTPAGKTGYATVEQAEQDYRHPNSILPGEFLLGYLNEYGEIPLSPTLSRSEDPMYRLVEDPETGQPDLGHNGSYLVLRQLEQDVRGFWQFCEQHAGQAPSLPLTPHSDPMVTIGAKLVGRWPNGVPLAVSPDRDMPEDPGEELTAAEKRRRTRLKAAEIHQEQQEQQEGHERFVTKMTNFDEFAYADEDPDGLRAPLGSHIRRANPRNSLVDDPVQSLKIVKHHRMLRRGRAYGPPLAESMEPHDLLKAPDTQETQQERGLHFICFNADITRQFEFVQQMWLDSGKFHGLREEVATPGAVPTMSYPGQPPSSVMTIPEAPVRAKLPGFSSFITVRGGAYFFMPSIRAVDYLSGKFAKAFPKQAAAVFNGGGVKAIAFTGALEEAEKRGIEWKGFAGTSGGAIVATLLAAKYSAHEIYEYMCGHMPPLQDKDGVPHPSDTDKFDPASIASRRALFGLPVLSPAINVLAHMGMYNSSELERTLTRMLHAKGIDTWADLRCTVEEKRELGTEYRLQLIATDLTNRRAIILPQDLHNYDLDPDAQSVAWCVRMSMAIPGFFEPVVLPYTDPKIVIVDGMLVSSFPTWVFNQDGDSKWPTLGFFLREGNSRPHRIRGVGALVWGAMTSGWSALDTVFADRYAEGRTLSIDVKGFPTINRSMTDDEREKLRRRGLEAAGSFFSKLGAMVQEGEAPA